MSDALITGIMATISALFSGAMAIIVAVIQNNSTRKLMEYKIDQLTQKVEKHNQVIERTYHLERRAEVFDEKISVANHRIADLETELKKHEDDSR